MNDQFDISSIDDKLTWQPAGSLMLLVRRTDGDRALVIQCNSVGDQWMLTRVTVASGDFRSVSGEMSTQELVGMFDDLPEALHTGTTVAREWLAAPSS